ncbi:MAG: biotin transporter BioY [Planctomycetota bacterium]
MSNAVNSRASGASREAVVALDRVLAGLGVVGYPLLMWAANAGGDFQVPIGDFAIPLTLQTLFVILAALSLGPRLGALSMILYIVMGAVGLPVFSEGNAGLATVFGRTGGYLLGFVLCVPMINGFVRRPDGSLRGWWWTLVGAVAGHLTIFAVGVPWLYAVLSRDPAFADVTFGGVVENGFLIFLPGMAIKCAIGAIAGYWAAPFAHRRGW